ncbi:MAG: gliding motility-associated ABC transporter permease subunit GldF [Flavobacteriaceae bacterium]|nr:gliding motility-associated ABC transporter permease subunit GldF [Flavobacteriaceae bacterium]
MFAILKKEIYSFFSTAIGYLVIGIFLITNGLFIWVFKGEFNILDYGFADLSGYYFIAPWIFIFLIPAITMKSFSEEKKQGTLEILLTTPINNWQLVLGKFLGAFTLIILALLPTVLYIYTVYQLGNPVGNIDLGSTFGAYTGLLGIAMIYCAIGIFTSAVSDNQIVAFLLAVLLCFTFYYGFEGLSETTGASIENIGIKAHFKNISKGILDSRDIIYFFSISALFLFFTSLTLTKK